MKTCYACQCQKPLDQFHKRATAKDGRNSYCKACDDAKRKARRDANVEQSRAKDNARYLVRREAKRAYDRDYYKRNAEDIQSRTEQYRLENAEALRPYNAQRASRRYAKKLDATPIWASSDKVRALYALAATFTELLGEPFEVDHIVPLVSKLVCGLHNEFNLRVVTQRENRTKSNTYWPGMP